MDIRQVIAAFAAVEEGLSITDPRAVEIRDVYAYLPPSVSALNLPCIMHQYRPVSEQRGPSGLRRRTYAIRIQLLLLALPHAETDLWSEIAASFDDALVTAFDERVALGLGEGATYQRLFDFGAQEYQPSMLEWNGKSYLGMQYEYEIQTHDTVPTMGA